MPRIAKNLYQQAHNRHVLHYNVLNTILKNSRRIENELKQKELIDISRQFSSDLHNNRRHLRNFENFHLNINALIENEDYNNLKGTISNIYRHLKLKQSRIGEILYIV